MNRHRAGLSATTPHLLAGKTLGVVGLGQMGGSLVKCLSRYHADLTRIGTDRNPRLGTQVRRYGRFTASLEEIVVQSDVLVLAVPVPEILTLLPKIARLTRERLRASRLLVTDTGTVKRPVLMAAERCRTHFDFVGMHPLAGTHTSGWKGSRADLFTGAPIFYCGPNRGRGVRWIRELIGLLGATPIPIPARQHDQMIGTTIGLPHLLAYAAEGLAREGNVPAIFKGRSWGSLTRVAASDPAMVAGFLTTNRASVTQSARQVMRRVSLLLAALKDPTGKELLLLLRRWTRRSV